jgi:zinc metalloprotease ZmpA
MVLSPRLRKAALLTALSGLAVLTATGSGAAQPPEPTAQASSRMLAAQAAASYVAERPAVLHASSADGFQQQPVISGGRLQYVPYERTHQGLPVVGGDFVVLTDAGGNITGTSAALDRTISGVGTRPSVGAGRAEQLSRARLDAVTSVTRPRLVVHALGTPRLTWETVVSGTRAGKPSRQTVYVDAGRGTVIAARDHVVRGEGTGAYNGPSPLTLDTTKSGGTYTMKDPKRDLVCQDVDGNKTFTGPDDAWGNGDAKNRETGCVDGLYTAQLEWKMLSEWLGRDGMDGKGGAWPLRVGMDDLNAYYDGSQVVIGHNQDGEWISAIDVVAHEFGHGVDDHTPGGISQGGTQEFIADVFGAVTEAYAAQDLAYDEPDFTVGEEVDLVGKGPIRNMYDPSEVEGHPNCYSEEIPNTEVHTAAGPGNHWFYLLAQGNKPDGGPNSPTCDNLDVTGIGVQKAAKVLYHAMLMKTSDSSYLKYRTWTLTAAKNLFPGGCTEFNTVKGAWDAVSVPAQPGDPTCGDPASAPPPLQPGDFTGIAALGNCSAAVVRYADSKPTDPALGLTNGHCLETGMPEPGVVLVDQPSERAFALLRPDGSSAGEVKANRLLYATMTKTDIALYRLGKTYQQLEDELGGFTPLTLAQKAPDDGTAMAVVSGYWNRVYSCSVDKTVHRLKEAGWTMEQSIKYKQPGCETIGGTSGSPVVDATTGEVIGANNTGNESGERCTMNNPCEVDEDGKVTVQKGASYGQQTHWLYSCLATGNVLDLTRPGCELPAP